MTSIGPTSVRRAYFTCPGCGQVLIERDWYAILSYRVTPDGRCPGCGAVVPGRFGIRLEDHFYVTDAGAAWFTEPQPSIDRPFD